MGYVMSHGAHCAACIMLTRTMRAARIHYVKSHILRLNITPVLPGMRAARFIPGYAPRNRIPKGIPDFARLRYVV